jgi:hypothetical protein
LHFTASTRKGKENQHDDANWGDEPLKIAFVSWAVERCFGTSEEGNKGKEGGGGGLS